MKNHHVSNHVRISSAHKQQQQIFSPLSSSLSSLGDSDRDVEHLHASGRILQVVEHERERLVVQLLADVLEVIDHLRVVRW